MSDADKPSPATVESTAAASKYSGPERRNAELTDRRGSPRGGRRLADRMSRVARFLHDLLTEQPR